MTIEFTEPRFNIMVSSTILDLRRERNAIREELERVSDAFRVWLIEDLGSDPEPPASMCVRFAKQCDLFILLLGRRYGYVPPGSKLSVTELEFESAIGSNKRKIRTYIKPLKHREALQVAFVQRVRDFRQGFLCPEFQSLTHLKRLVSNDVVRYYRDTAKSSTKETVLTIDPSKGNERNRPFGPDRESPKPPIEHVQRVFLQTTSSQVKSRKLAHVIVSSLTTTEREALSLLQTGRMLATLPYLRPLIPRYPWARLLRKFKACGLVQVNGTVITIAPNVARVLEANSELMRNAHAEWIRVLEPKASEYFDLALALCLHLFSAGERSRSIRLVHSLVFAVEDSESGELVNTLLTGFKAPTLFKVLDVSDRLLVLDGLAVYRAKEGKTAVALRLLNEMLAAARRINDTWAVGQALLHRGVAMVHGGKMSRAEIYNRQAIAWARKTRDKTLSGKAWNNLSQCLIATNPRAAEKALEKSLRYKLQAGDRDGVFAAQLIRGQLSGEAGNHRESLQWFKKAEVEARLFRNQYWLALSLHNQAIARKELGDVQKAMQLSRNAVRIARILGWPDFVTQTIRGAAVISVAGRRYKDASRLFEELCEQCSRAGDMDGAVSALSDAGASHLEGGRAKEAVLYFRRALRLAKQHRSYGSVLACLGNYVTALRIVDLSGSAATLLEAEYSWALKSKQFTVACGAARLWAEHLINIGASHQAITQAWKCSAAAAGASGNTPKHFETLVQLYAWQRDTFQFNAGLETLKQLVLISQKRRALRRDYVLALNETGSTMQELERFKEAETYHRMALKHAEKCMGDHVPDSVLINMAELLRKTGRARKAIPLYKRAIKICRAADDVSGAMLADHNYALALRDVGDIKGSTRRLFQILEESERKKLWNEHVNARLALANNLNEEGKHGLALRWYKRVRDLAKRHNQIELLLHSSLNESQLRLAIGSPEAAVALLEPLQSKFECSVLAACLDGWLASAYLEVGQDEKAALVAERGLQRQAGDGGAENRERLWKVIARAAAKVRSIRRVEDGLRHAVSDAKTPAERAAHLRRLLLIVGVREASKSRSGTRTQKVFDRIINHGKRHRDWEFVLSSAEELADLLEDIDRKSAIEICFVATIANGSYEGWESIIPDGSRIAVRLWTIGQKYGDQELERLQKEIEAWLRHKAIRNVSERKAKLPEEVVSTFMWPFRFAFALLNRAQGPSLSRKEIERLIETSVRTPPSITTKGKGRE